MCSRHHVLRRPHAPRRLSAPSHPRCSRANAALSTVLSTGAGDLMRWPESQPKSPKSCVHSHLFLFCWAHLATGRQLLSGFLCALAQSGPSQPVRTTLTWQRAWPQPGLGGRVCPGRSEHSLAMSSGHPSDLFWLIKGFPLLYLLPST